MKKILTTGWSLMRVLRLVTGVGAVAYTFISHEVLLGVAGVFLVAMSLFNVGCCCTSSCPLPKQPRHK